MVDPLHLVDVPLRAPARMVRLMDEAAARTGVTLNEWLLIMLVMEIDRDLGPAAGFVAACDLRSAKQQLGALD